MRQQNRALKAGFTLIELLVVVAILVILAGLILPKLDKIQLKSNKAVAAANIHDVSRYIQTYRVLHNFYPDRWDSLLTSGGTPALWEAATLNDQGLDPQLVGGPIPASPEKLTIATFASDDEIRSLSRIGIGTMLDLGTGGIPGDRFTQPRTIANGATYATINTADGDGRALIDHIYPENRLPTGTSGAIPGGKKLIVVGVGPLNSMIGDVVQDTPFYSNTDPAKYYHRFLAIFEFSTGGSRAELKAVVGTDADRLDEEINDFYE